MSLRGVIGVLARMGLKSTGSLIDQVVDVFQFMTGAQNDVSRNI